MQKDIHPDNHLAEFKCACGNAVKVNTTLKGEAHTLDICNKCHPFFTKKQKLVDSGGRVDKFNKKLAAASDKQTTKK